MRRSMLDFFYPDVDPDQIAMDIDGLTGDAAADPSAVGEPVQAEPAAPAAAELPALSESALRETRLGLDALRQRTAFKSANYAAIETTMKYIDSILAGVDV